MSILIIGPYPPLKGGISDFNFKLFNHLKKYQSSFFISFDRNYPFFLRSKKKQVLNTYTPNQNILRINPYNPLSYIKIIKFIKNKNIDKIISTYWTPIIGLPYLLINSIVSKKITKIGLFHNIFPHENYLLSKQILKFYINTLNKAITLSEHSSKQLLDISNLVSQSLFIPVDNLEKTSKSISLNKLNLNKNYKYILFIGMIRKYKGLKLLLKAFKKVIEIKKNVKLIIAGEFIENKKDYLKLIDELSLNKNIILNDNFIEPSNIKYYINASEIIIQPYIKATQSGITSLAISYNKIIVTTGAGGIKEIINNDNGYICSKDQISISKNIISALKSKNEKKIEELILLKKKISWNNFCSHLIKKI
tara:strand:+ start:13692 stop:14783 length:1092 start_codon:yes stop_codon:yes gene_type:complete